MSEIQEFNTIIEKMSKELSGMDKDTKLLVLELFYLVLDNPKLIKTLNKEK